jgi:hypothetical protein
MTLLLAATLLWGGCLSCAQYFMFPSASAKTCCMPSGECRNKQSSQAPSPKECSIQALARTDARVDLEHASIVVSSLAVLPHQILPAASRFSFQARGNAGFNPEASPPDLCLLNSVFRV